MQLDVFVNEEILVGCNCSCLRPLMS